MLLAYFDESGHEHEHGIVAIGGWIASADTFAAFEQQWANFLSKYELAEFHAKDISQHYGPCAGWPQRRINRLMSDAIDVIAEHRLAGISLAIKVSDHRRVIGGNDWLRKRFGSPYEMCCRMAIESAYVFTGRSQNLSVVFAPNAAYDAAIMRCRERYVGDRLCEGRIKNVTAAGTSSLIPLQAADLIAYETFIYVNSHFFGETPRKHISYKRLLTETPVAEPRHLDAEGLCQLALSVVIGDTGIKSDHTRSVQAHLRNVCLSG